jgi:hypothetical protein
MGRQVSVTKLKEQIEAAKRSLAEMSAVTNAADPLFQPVATQAANFVGLTVKREDYAPDALGQDMATGDMATGDGFQFFHRLKWRDRSCASPSPISMANADISTTGGDQSLFQALDQRLGRLEKDIAQNQKHILELITLLSGLGMAAQPARQNSALVKYLLRRNLYWFVIGFLVIGWVALTPSGHHWINYFLGLI